MAATLTLTVKVTDTQLKNLEARIAALEKKAVINVRVNSNGLEQVDGSMNSLGKSTEYATRSVNDLGTAIASKIKWGAIQGAIQGVATAFRTAVSNMKEVDTQLTNIAKVTNQSVDQLSGLADKAYSTASKYGIEAGQYMEAVYEYTKAGFADNADQMAELSTKAMLVGDTTASVADKFLIAGNAAFGFGGDIGKLSMMVDQADFINNNYATTLDKIAEGFPRVASVASMAGMSAEETMAALGTITATTQETASRASTALRALIINILGDTSTEIEDGVTATEESINGLRDALNKYAPDVVKAADATGQLINPMEALQSLAEAYKNGDLTEQGLFDIESALGGKLRTNQLDALLKNFDTYKEMLAGMGDAAGTADAEISVMLTSWESKTKILENTWTEFVSKSFDSDFFKGFIDGLTQVLNLFGNFGNMLLSVSGIVVALKLPSIINHFKQMGTSIKNAAINIKNFVTGASSAAAALNVLQIAIAAATIAFTAVSMAHQDYLQRLDQNIDKSSQEAELAQSTADNIYQLYGAYNSAKQAVEQNSGSTEDAAIAQYNLESATRNLASALGIEQGAVEDLEGAIESMTEADLQATLEKNASAYQDLEIRLAQQLRDKATEAMFNPFMNQADVFLPNLWSENAKNGYDAQIQAVLDGYDEIGKKIEYLRKLQKAPSGSVYASMYGDRAKEEIGKDLAAWENVYTEYGEWIGQMQTLQEKNVEAQDRLDKFAKGEIIAEEEATVTTRNFATSFAEVAEAAESAKTAVERYNEAIKEQTGDDYAALNKAVTSALEDIEKGYTNSTNIRAAADWLFSDEAILEMNRRGIDVIDRMGGEFIKNWVGYFDDEENWKSTGGEDMGAKFLEGLMKLSPEDMYDGWATSIDEAGNRIIEKNGEIVASLHYDGEGGIEYEIQNASDLADALGLTVDAIEPVLEALGVYDSELNKTSAEVETMARKMGALNQDGGIRLQPFIEGLRDSGSGLEEILNYIDLINNSEELHFSMDYGDIDAVKEYAKGIFESDPVTVKTEADTTGLANLEEEMPEDPTVEVKSETEEADEALEETSGKAEDLDGQTPTVNVQVNAVTALNVISNFKTQLATIPTKKDVTINVTQKGDTKVGGSASGTKNAKGGLTLVNEKGPEIIAEEGTARIAGGGLPTLTVLQKGAMVFNADETRQIFERSGVQALSDGTLPTIGSKRGRVPIYQPEGSSSDGGGNSGGNDSGGNSGGNDGGSYTPPADTTPTDDKDATLEALKADVERQKSWLKYSEALKESLEVQYNWQLKIAEALLNQIHYLEQTGGDQTEINNLYAEYYGVLEAADELQEKAVTDRVSLLKSELELLEAKDAPISEQIAKQREIYNALSEQITLAWQQGKSQEEINELLTERRNVLNDIHDLELEDAEGKVSLLKSQLEVLEAQDKPVADQIAKEKEIYDALGEQMTLLWRQGADEEEINKLIVERAEIRKKIIEQRKEEKKQREQEKADLVSLLRSELALLEARGASVKKQIEKEREIAKAIKEQIKAAKAAGATQEEINKLKQDYYNTTAAIKQLEQGLYDNLTEAVNNKISKINEQRDKELAKLKEKHDLTKKQNELEEKQNAIEEARVKLAEAREKLANAKAQRNVRIYNARTGQWEWVANAKDVDSAREGVTSARESLQDAKDSLKEYKRQEQYEKEVDRINAKYDKQVEKWQKVLDALTEPAMSLSRALRSIEKNATKAMGSTLKALNKLLKPLGYNIDTSNLYDDGGVLKGIGGIKAVSADEMILPPDLTKAMLNPVATSMFNTRMNELRYLYGATTGMNSNSGSSVGEQINGNVYQYGNIQLTESQAKSTTVYDLAQMARGLRSYTATAK